MSGHSKWSSIKHRKAAQDSKRGKIFTKLIKEITIAARIGGGDIDGNPRLRTAVTNARAESMPKENIDRAIKKGSGDLDGFNYEEIIYEGYGPHNVAIIVEVLTDNRNRTIASVRHIFSKSGGNLGSTNSVQYMFDRKGLICVEKSVIEEDYLLEIILEAGADDLNTEDDVVYEIVTSTANFSEVQNILESKEVSIKSAEIAWIPQVKVEIDDQQKAEQVMRLIDKLEDDDDVQKVFTNVDIDDSIMEQIL